MDPLTVSLGELIAALGDSVAGAQLAIDGRTLQHFAAIYEQNIQAFEPLRAIGYQPTWYHVSEAAAEVKLALSVTRSPDRRDVHAAPVDADYQARFGFRSASASSLKVRIVPVPRPLAADV